MSKHTPGPWHADGAMIYDADGGIVGQAALCPECEPNARLIAAAPELLEALTLAAQFLSSVALSAPWNDRAAEIRPIVHAAIARAEGRT